jgi:L-ascorbate metabolism protein UlaG (beta-lactamase superfamily)
MATVTITRVAHSSVLIDFDGTKVLTDLGFQSDLATITASLMA